MVKWQEVGVLLCTTINMGETLAHQGELATSGDDLNNPEKAKQLLKSERDDLIDCPVKGGIYKSQEDYKKNKLTDFGQFLPRSSNEKGILFFDQNGQKVKVKAEKEKYYGFQNCKGDNYRLLKNGVTRGYYVALVEGKACVYARGDVVVHRDENGYVSSMEFYNTVIKLYYTNGVDAPELLKIKDILRQDAKLFAEYKRELKNGKIFTSTSEYMFRDISYIMKYNAKHQQI